MLFNKISTNAPNRFLAFILDRRFTLFLFILLAVIASSKQYLRGNINNYLIFKGVYLHSIQQLDLYLQYPGEYLDSNHYGPFFALLIAPFALLPDAVGTLLWNIANMLILWWGIYQLPIKENQRSWIAIICSHEALTSLFSFQFNLALAGSMLLCFSYIVKQQSIKAVFMIIIGLLVKLYGIVGLAFFFFFKKKWQFIVAGLILLPILAFLPAILSNPSYVVDSYKGWYTSLVEKNSQNASLNSYQDISLMGMVRRISGDVSIPNTPFLIGGLILFGLPYLRISQYKYIDFKLALLSSVLIFTVIFSSGSESPTYIIAMLGVAIWFIMQPQPREKWQIALFIFALLLTSFSPSDLFPKFVREQYIIPYSLKALPCVVIWLVIVYQMMTTNYNQQLNYEN
jgi:hypothetical protein